MTLSNGSKNSQRHLKALNAKNKGSLKVESNHKIGREQILVPV